MKKRIVTFLLIIALFICTYLGVFIVNAQNNTHDEIEEQPVVFGYGEMTDERKKLLEEKQNYINNSDSNTGMDANGYYNQNDRVCIQNIDEEESKLLMENHHKQEIESAKKLEKLQQAIIIVNNKRNTNYTVIDKIEMDYDVMADATEICENNNLSKEELEFLKYYLNNFVISILPEDPLKNRIDNILNLSCEID